MKAKILLLLIVLFPMIAYADIVDDIQARKKIVVGVKTDYKPYGYLATDGSVQGVEPDLARLVADKLNVDIEFVSVVSANRIEYLQQRKIDLMIATMTDKPDRRKKVLASDPNYYSSGTNVIARKAYDFNQWEELSGKKICGITGAFYNQSMEERYGARVITFNGTKQALLALKLDKCIAFVYDDSFIAGLLTDASWSNDYEMPFETIDDAPWALAVANGEERLHTILNEMIVDWHKKGEVLRLEAKHGLKMTPFAVRMHQQYNEILKVHTKNTEKR